MKSSHVSVIEESILLLLERFSSLQKIFRIVAYILRFNSNLKNSADRKTGPLSMYDLDEAQRRLTFGRDGVKSIYILFYKGVSELNPLLLYN
ncbi:hypothetical protein NQ317_004196 [Molorchus minor]|uniref:Uncharacterized protein n=1 Tax=Molorchus minor TaxID=1323400 RepID=A0ABQ9JCR3_9CUCU|nr:hypothetical protein NQ317_004196 [Molorchus minor]